MLMDFISYDYRKQLANPGKQICMECFFVPGSALCNIGNKLKNARITCGFTQEEIAVHL